MSPALDRARADLSAAELLVGAGFAPQAVACAFRASRHAADAALLAIGETRSTDAATVGAFVQRVVRQRGLDPKAGQLLRSLHNRALLANLSYDPVPPDEAGAAVRDATAVVDAVEAWLEEPVRTANGHVTRRAAPVPPKERPARRRR
ncbi:HEPN domain-containing protein [Pseudonocardia sp.]|uniref:HEPN domain-containing protein n=1 Tax=Pseudonocardia sp. TaxID=60912 RepID=UPI003D13E1F9